MFDFVLTNANIITMDPDKRPARTIAISDGRIRAIGSDADLAQAASARTIDLAGRTIIPGLIDAHTHLEGTATNLAFFADCHVPPHRTIADILQSLADHATAYPDEPWVIGQGSFMLREKLAEGRLPSLAEMDAAVPDRPALIRAGAHISVVNTRGLETIGITDDYVPPAGAHVVRDDQGRPTGELIEMYWSIGVGSSSRARTRDAVAAMAARLSSYGITSVQDQFPSGNGLRAYQDLARDGRFPLRISFTIHTPTVAAVETFLKTGFESGFGNDFLKFGAAKFFVDGGITGAAGAFYDDYAHMPGNKGHLKLDRADIFTMIRLLNDADLQISTHVVGDLALDTLLDAYEAHPPSWGRRHRLEHAGHLCITPERIARIKGMGLIPVVTMPFLHSFGDFLVPHLGQDRAAGAFAVRRLLDAGLPVPGSSDSLGAQPESLNPWFGMWCAIARETRTGQLLAPEEAITPYEALTMYTRDAAWTDFAEGITGSLAVGKAADLVVLDHDPLTQPIAEIPTIQPIATVLAGKVVSGSLPG